MDTLFPVSGGVGSANVVVEDARQQDMAAVQAIYAPHVLQGLATFEEQPPDLSEMSRRRDVVLALGLPFLVARQGGAVVGYCYAGATQRGLQAGSVGGCCAHAAPAWTG